MEKILALSGLTAVPLLAAVMLWLWAVSAGHVRTAEKCGRWLVAVAVFAVVSITSMTVTCIAGVVAYTRFGWLTDRLLLDRVPWIAVVAAVVLFVWLTAYRKGSKVHKRPRTVSEPPVHDYGPSQTAADTKVLA